MTRLKLMLFALSACLMFPAIVHAQTCDPTHAPLSVSPTTARQGQPVTIRIGLLNCTDQGRLVRARIGILSTASVCSQFNESFVVPYTEVPAGQLVFVSSTVSAPKCTSTYNVGRLVIPNDTGYPIFVKEATLTVVPACSPTSPGFMPSVSVAPTTAEEGESVTVTVGVISCFSSAKVFTANVNITPTSSACVSSASAFQVSGIIQADQTATFTHTFAAPKCASTYDVKMPGAKAATLKVVPVTASGLTLRVTNPLNNSTVTNPVHVAATASGPNPIAQIQIWVNYKEVFHVSGGSLNANVTLPVGSNERFVVQAEDSKGNLAKVVDSITVK